MSLPLLSRSAAVLLVVDMQERMLAAIPEVQRASIVRHIAILMETARTLGIPILRTEQYPKGLGPTIPEIAALAGPDPAIEKLSFSCGRSPDFQRALDATGRRSVLLCGVETHVCILQTCIDLAGGGYAVSIPADAVASRRMLDWETALRLLDRAGAIVGTTETFVFQLLERAGTDEFRTISKLLK
jgi:nicotinamidase-related amidase